jgi:hypothetical protein
MNHLGDAHLRTWALRFMALLAADTRDQLAWLGEHELETKDVVEEVEFLCRVSEGLAERGAFEPKDLRDLRAIGRRLGEIDAACRVGLWPTPWPQIRRGTASVLSPVNFSSRRWATGVSHCHALCARTRVTLERIRTACATLTQPAPRERLGDGRMGVNR